MIRPGWDVEVGADAHLYDGHCFYYWPPSGWCLPGGIDWEGMQGAHEQGDRIGMLIDLDQGSMTVWKNDEKMGVMVAEGLASQWGSVAVLVFVSRLKRKARSIGDAADR